MTVNVLILFYYFHSCFMTALCHFLYFEHSSKGVIKHYEINHIIQININLCTNMFTYIYGIFYIHII